MKKNIERIRAYLEQAQNKRDKVKPLNENQIEKIASILKNNNGLKFIDSLYEYSPYSENALFLRNNNFDDEATKILDELKAKAEAADLDTAVAPKLKEFITFFGDGAKAYFSMIRFYMLISNSYFLFLSKYEKYKSWNAKKVFKFIMKLGKEAGAKITGSAEEFFKAGTHNIKDLFEKNGMSDDEFAKTIEEWLKNHPGKAKEAAQDIVKGN